MELKKVKINDQQKRKNVYVQIHSNTDFMDILKATFYQRLIESFSIWKV